MQATLTDVETPCRNCNTLLAESAAFCYVCGQKKAKRLTWRSFGVDVVTAYAGFDGQLFTTLRGMLLRPGHMVREYLSGKQKPYLKPIGYYLFGLGLYFVVTTLLKVDPLEVGQQVNQDMGLSTVPNTPQGQTLAAKAREAMSSNIKIIFSVLVPTYAVAIFILYRKSGYNYIEMLVYALYMYGTSYLFYIAQSFVGFVGIQSVWGKVAFYVIFFASLFYTLWATYQFFGGGNGWRLLKSFAAYLLSFVLYGILSVGIGVLIGLSLRASQP